MLLFRSEDHATRWRERARPVASTTLSLDKAARLAHAWYRDKLSDDYRRHTADEAEAIFRDLGLDREFWRLR